MLEKNIKKQLKNHEHYNDSTNILCMLFPKKND